MAIYWVYVFPYNPAWRIVMTKTRSVSVTFTDLHIPYQCDDALEVLKKVVHTVKPDITSSLGDLLDCSQFSTHEPTYGVGETGYDADLEHAKSFLDDLQKHTKQRLVLVEGNHCQRVERWAAKNKEGRSVYNMIAPHIQLMKTKSGQPRKNATYVKYGSADGKYPHYKLNSRIALVHGWSYSVNTTHATLSKSQGISVIFGHCHRMESRLVQNVWGEGVIQCHAIGCLCQKIPLYGTGTPVEWTNGFCIGYHGSHSDTIYPITIVKGSCVLPDGREIKI